jgi:hypothetical protein
MHGLPPASAAIFTSYLYHSTSTSPRDRAGIRRQPTPHARPPACVDARIAFIIDTPLALGESMLFGVTRKEAELLALFATLTVAQSRAYYARLWSPNSTDPLASKLAQLGSDRKQRLIMFLGRHRAYR